MHGRLATFRLQKPSLATREGVSSHRGDKNGAPMSSSEAAQVARLRLDCREWRIGRTEDGYAAVHRQTGERVRASTPGALEWEMRERREHGGKRIG